MAKKIDSYIKLQVPAGQANPSPPIGPALGQHGVNIMEFCKISSEMATQNWNDRLKIIYNPEKEEGSFQTKGIEHSVVKHANNKSEKFEELVALISEYLDPSYTFKP